MLRIIKLLTICFTVTVVACIPPKIILNTQYTNSNYDDPSLAIVLEGEPQVNYSGNVEPEFGPGDQNTLIRNFFKKQLIEDIISQTKLKHIEFEQCTPNGYFEKQVIANSPIDVLQDGGKYECQNPDPAYILVLSGIYIGTSMETQSYGPTMGANGMMFGGGSHTQKNLTYQAKAFLYDNRAKQFVEYGIIDESASGFFPVITLNVWKQTSEAFVQKIFFQTKLIKPLELSE